MQSSNLRGSSSQFFGKPQRLEFAGSVVAAVAAFRFQPRCLAANYCRTHIELNFRCVGYWGMKAESILCGFVVVSPVHLKTRRPGPFSSGPRRGVFFCFVSAPRRSFNKDRRAQGCFNVLLHSTGRASHRSHSNSTPHHRLAQIPRLENSKQLTAIKSSSEFSVGSMCLQLSSLPTLQMLPDGTSSLCELSGPRQAEGHGKRPTTI